MKTILKTEKQGKCPGTVGRQAPVGGEDYVIKAHLVGTVALTFGSEL